MEFMFITNRVDIAKIADQAGIDRVWIDLETLGKEERQKSMNTVKSKHSLSDISKIKPVLQQSKLQVRINPWNDNSQYEIDTAIENGADIIMLPMFKACDEVKGFINAVGGRTKVNLLVETREAVENIDSILKVDGIDEIHIGLNDLHLSYQLQFMFELLINGVVEKLSEKIRLYGIPFGFGGIAQLGAGIVRSENIMAEHIRLGSSRVILSRSFFDIDKCDAISIADRMIKSNVMKLRDYEKSLILQNDDFFGRSHQELVNQITNYVDKII